MSVSVRTVNDLVIDSQNRTILPNKVFRIVLSKEKWKIELSEDQELLARPRINYANILLYQVPSPSKAQPKAHAAAKAALKGVRPTVALPQATNIDVLTVTIDTLQKDSQSPPLDYLPSSQDPSTFAYT